MGQYFKVVNIDKLQDFGHMGKFVEYFFSSSPRKLLFALALGTNTPLHSEPYYSFARSKTVNSWAGDRIICLGDSSEDTPDGMLDDMELEEFGDLNELRTERIRPSTPELGSNGNNVWVLRNLTKHEYVRSDVDGLSQDFCEPYALRGKPGLGHALVSRISWSSYISMSYHDSDKVARGVWAGDRFDIRTIESLEDGDEGGEEWKDVSGEVVAELLAMWESG